MNDTSILSAELDQRRRQAWQKLIDEKLLSWLSAPSQLEDEGIDAPSATIIRLSLDLAEKFRDEAFPAPDSILPDPNGGIVFERREGGVSEVFRVWDDGSVEYMLFHGTELAERWPLFESSTPKDGESILAELAAERWPLLETADLASESIRTM